MAKKLSFKDLNQKDHYKNVIKLLFFHVDKENGLRQQHFRYALMEKPIFSKRKETQKKKMEHFKRFFETGGIYICASDEFKKTPFYEELKSFGAVKGCIKSRQKLTNYLNKLEEMKIIEKTCNKKPDVRYKLTKYYQHETLKLHIKRHMDEHSADSTYTQRHFNKIMDHNYNSTWATDTSREEWILFGLSPRTVDKLTPLDQDQLKEWITGIEKNLHNVLELIYKKQGSAQSPSDIFFSFIGQKWN